jgi:uncharacterized membrane protein YfcA
MKRAYQGARQRRSKVSCTRSGRPFVLALALVVLDQEDAVALASGLAADCDLCDHRCMLFPASGVRVNPFWPFLAALGISTFTSTAGVSGAFVLLPFQVSVLGFVSPAVTPTNHLFNVIAIPSGVYRYIREGRMVWPLSTVILIGTVPGVVLGSLARIRYLPDPRHFKLFVGGVLLLIGSRLLLKVLRPALPATDRPAAFQVRTLRFDLLRLVYEFAGREHSVSCPALFGLTAVIGIIGGAYGVGGGAIIAPFLVSLFGLPVHTIAGATLSGTWLTSVVAVGFFSLAQPLLALPSLAPDWWLGALFGAGGLLGMYCGARLQKRLPARLIEGLLALLVNGLALSYLVGFWLPPGGLRLRGGRG